MFNARGLFTKPVAKGGRILPSRASPVSGEKKEEAPKPTHKPSKKSKRRSTCASNVAPTSNKRPANVPTTARYDRSVAKDMFEKVLNELRLHQIYAHDQERREFVLSQLGALLHDDHVETDSAALESGVSVGELLVERLRSTAELLINPAIYNSNGGRLMLHIFYQALADPKLGGDDDRIKEICTLLGAGSEATVKTCFQERKEHGLGYLKDKKIRADVTPEWVVQVCFLYLHSPSLFLHTHGHLDDR